MGATGCLSSATQCHRSYNFISKISIGAGGGARAAARGSSAAVAAVVAWFGPQYGQELEIGPPLLCSGKRRLCYSIMLLETRHYALIMLHYAAYNSAYKMEFTYKSTYKIEPVGEHCQTEGPPTAIH